jgi:hypothetical protein
MDEEITKTILLMMGINVSSFQETPQARFLMNWIWTTSHRHVPPKKWKRHPQQKHQQRPLAQSLLRGADQMKIGFCSRNSPKNAYEHAILATQFYRPKDFAMQIPRMKVKCGP